jgi:multiple sugar transport system substrate-binding protein
MSSRSNSVSAAKRTIQALEYAKELYDTFVPGTLSWLDPSNNKAFLAGECGLTSNGISVYYAANTGLGNF